ncbi:MAG: FtsQ-type POTRA domain-containing protein [Oscillospiraceae bacterium]|nr:FtsQ-type POTRA domain-containing protein [Oscillospiraceae bacterium]
MPAVSSRKLPPSSKHDEFRPARKRGGVSALVGFLVIVVAVIFVMSVFFRVSDIRVEGNEHYTDQEIINASGIEEGDNLFFFDKFSALSRAYTKLPYLEEVTVDRRLPGRVTINVVECKAMAYISVGDENWTIDHNCKVLGKAVETELADLIPIYGIDPGTLMIGEKLERADGNEEMVDYLSLLLREQQERGIASEVRRIDFSDPFSVSFALGEKYTVRVGGPMKLDHKFAMLFSVLEQLKEGDSGTIDVSDGSTARFIPY